MAKEKKPTDKDERVVITADPPVDDAPYLEPDDAEVQAALVEVLGDAKTKSSKGVTVLRIGGLRRRC